MATFWSSSCRGEAVVAKQLQDHSQRRCFFLHFSSSGVSVYMLFERLLPALLDHIVQRLDPVTQILLCNFQTGVLFITVILCSVSACWRYIRWMHVVSLSRVSAVFFPDKSLMRCDSATQRMSMLFLWQTELDILSWSQLQSQWWPQSAHGPVRSHLSPCIVLVGPNLFFPRRTTPPYEGVRRSCHLNMAGGWVNVYSVTVFASAERLSFELGHLKWCGRWCSQTRRLLPYYLTTFCTVASIKWLYAFGKGKPRNKTVHNDRWYILQSNHLFNKQLFISPYIRLRAMPLTTDIDLAVYDSNVCLLYGEV